MLRLEYERKQRGWTQSDVARRVAELTGASCRLRLQTIISRLELKQTKPTEAELAVLAHVFQISPPWVLLQHVVVVAKDVDEQVPV